MLLSMVEPTPLMLFPRPVRAPPATLPAVETVPEMAPETALEIAPVIHSVAMVVSGSA